MEAWHFLNGKFLRDGREAPKDGEWLYHKGPCIMCLQGLHASKRIIDALKYAPGNVLCRVDVRKIEEEEDDKLVARERKILYRVSAEPLLRAFARWCALQVVDNWNPPAIVLKYLKTGKDAKSAAWSAAWSAARSATRSATWRAADSAADSAAWSAADCDSWSAARNAAWSAAWSAARNAQEVALQEFVQEARRGYEEWEFTL